MSIINNAEGGTGEFVLRRKRNGFFQCQLGRLKSARAKIDNSQIRKRIEVVRALGQDLLILLFGRAIFALFEIFLGRSCHSLQLLGHVRIETVRRIGGGAGGRLLRPGRFVARIRPGDVNRVHGRFLGECKTCLHRRRVMI